MGRGYRNEPVGKATAAVASAQWEVEEGAFHIPLFYMSLSISKNT
jgi:hypothetical protein